MKDYEGFQAENHKASEVVPSGVAMNVVGLLIFAVVGVPLGFVFHGIWGYLFHVPAMLPAAIPFLPLQILLWVLFWVLAFVGALLAFEMIRGIAWSKHTEVKVDFLLTRSVLRICHCDMVIRKRHYLAGLITPAIVLGIVPTLVGVFAGNFFVLLLGVTMIMMGADGFLLIWRLRKHDKDGFVKDIGDRFGVVVYEPVN